MFRERDPQVSLWQSEFLVPPKKARRLERSWAEVFRNEALPLIDEERFAPMYCADNGRPNRAVQTVLGVHLLKEMFNLTDDEALAGCGRKVRRSAAVYGASTVSAAFGM